MPNDTVPHDAVILGRSGRWGGLSIRCTCGKRLAYDRGDKGELRAFIGGVDGGCIYSVSQAEIDNLMTTHRDEERA